ncbi:MAG: GTP-binding protein [Candidatus Thermoplasmatota archaeon]|nr:GTP-binding protein [Candidatus Thermoplasmatota archaeon]
MSPSIEEQIKTIEDEIFNTQKNKATEHHIGKLKAKIARLREDLQKQKSSGTKGKGFSIKKAGDATVGIIGFPSVGKSTLLNEITRASSKIGDYDFTTLDVIPGVLQYKGAEIQILDLPGLIIGASKGRGRGREILSAIRNVDLALLMVDVYDIEKLSDILQELYDAGLRLNQDPPDVVVTKRGMGGILINSTVPQTQLSEKTMRSIASEFVINAQITLREDVSETRFMDAFSENRLYVKAMVVINKIDVFPRQEVEKIVNKIREQGWCVIPISAKIKVGIYELKAAIFSELDLIRIYMKPVGKTTDYTKPLILRHGDTVEQACRKLHREFVKKFRYAIVSGPSAKHPSQKIGLDHHLKDTDILTIVIIR